MHWSDWGPPLRPSEEDIRLFRSAVGKWAASAGRRRAAALLLGVTPELAVAKWPVHVYMEALDRSPEMVKNVWPGDVPGLRRARVADWEDHGVRDGSVDVVMADGSFVFFDDEACVDLIAGICRAMRPDGMLAVRGFAPSRPGQSVGEALEEARSGLIQSFHELKWRVAAALQDGPRGVRQHDVWEAITGSGDDFDSMPQPGFSRTAVSTIRFYERKEARLFFHTAERFAELLMEKFSQVRYEFTSSGPGYPFFTALRAPGKESP